MLSAHKSVTIYWPEAYRSGHNEAVLKTVWVKAHGGSNPSASATHGICSKPREKKGKQFAFLFSLSSKTPCRVLLRRSGTERVTLRKASLFRRRAPYESLSLRHTRRNATHVNRRRRYAVSCQFFVGFSFFPKHSAILRAQRGRASFREFFTFLKILCFEPIPVYIIFGCRDKAISLSVLLSSMWTSCEYKTPSSAVIGCARAALPSSLCVRLPAIRYDCSRNFIRRNDFSVVCKFRGIQK